MARRSQPTGASCDSPRGALRRDGYAVCRGVFTAAEMDDLLRDIEAADGRKPHPDILSRGTLRFVSNSSSLSRATTPS